MEARVVTKLRASHRKVSFSEIEPKRESIRGAYSKIRIANKLGFIGGIAMVSAALYPFVDNEMIRQTLMYAGIGGVVLEYVSAGIGYLGERKVLDQLKFKV